MKLYKLFMKTQWVQTGGKLLISILHFFIIMNILFCRILNGMKHFYFGLYLFEQEIILSIGIFPYKNGDISRKVFDIL